MTTTSDVTVTLWTDATTPVQTQSGLAGGLRTAWDSLLGSVTVILTGLAALLPWLVLLVPLSLLALRVWRRRSAGMPSATSHTAGDLRPPPRPSPQRRAPRRPRPPVPGLPLGAERPAAGSVVGQRPNRWRSMSPTCRTSRTCRACAMPT